ncbi:hypothetical protein [Nostoc sp. KVJ3]|nr:hypothetical protein [Nostoc sp. KVJ3]
MRILISPAIAPTTMEMLSAIARGLFLDWTDAILFYNYRFSISHCL